MRYETDHLVRKASVGAPGSGEVCSTVGLARSQALGLALSQALAESRSRLGEIQERLEQELCEPREEAWTESTTFRSTGERAALCRETLNCLSRSTAVVRHAVDALGLASTSRAEEHLTQDPPSATREGCQE